MNPFKDNELIDFGPGASKNMRDSVIYEHGQPPYRVLSTFSEWVRIQRLDGGHEGWSYNNFTKYHKPVQLPEDLFNL